MPSRQSASYLVELRHGQPLPVIGAGKTHLVGHDDIGDHLRSEDVLSLSIQQIIVNGLISIFLEGHEESIIALLEKIGPII